MRTHSSGSCTVHSDCLNSAVVAHPSLDWSDEKSIEILKTIRKSIPAHGKVLVIESVLPELAKPDPEAAALTLLDLHMMVCTPKGKERTEKQWVELFAKAGFKLHNKINYASHKY